MELSLTSEQKLIQENIIGFAKKELNKDVIERDQQQQFPIDLWKKCAEQKLTGLPVDEKFGGAGLDPFTAIIALEALGYGSEDGGLNFSVCAHLLACVIPIWKYGNENQKNKYLPDLCNGNKIAVNAMTESESGSDVFNIKTTAKKKDNGFVINGTKTFCSNGPVADVVLVYALTDESKGYYGGITAFIVDKNAIGYKVGQQYEKMGLRTSGISELIFENVFVSEEDIVGGVGGGATVFNHSMEWERTGMAACHVGTMQKLLEKSIEYAQTRKSGGEVIGKKQAVSHRIATMKIQLEAARLLTYKSALGLEKNKENTIHAASAKLFVSEAYVAAAMSTMQIFGGNGYMTEYGIERIVRDALGSTVYSGTSDIQRNIISRLLGL
ncbi:MAG: acyl-CoA/acyl-ACP dehydrogenase [Bacteroidetes bacterium]|nr:acyl-CoA/acyl-ACP dehydrogenase [Bacteroidota bacterium]